ncbi:DUF3592 domain-containing protein [Novosphingobium rosa]|uniref:DUF3592 domain-containing protein n=1 Tax=Novosphingobium rosa TaxID=76978 RepID=UPI00082AA393|nr:DUF3592 domain-containing protein [Novosphingobium rosa]
MKNFFKYLLIPVALQAIFVVISSILIAGTTAYQRQSWPQTIATVLQSEKWKGPAASHLHPDLAGTVQYTIGGKQYLWHGRGRDMGVTDMTVGRTIPVYYNPDNFKEINTLIPLGWFVGLMILVGELSFLIAYIWFFWLRRTVRNTPDLVGMVEAPSPDRQKASASVRRRPSRNSRAYARNPPP